VLLGPNMDTPRKYVFGGRNRMDASSNEYIRTVRDKRYRYIRNFTPQIERSQRIDYMEKMPIMQQWRLFHKQGKLNEIQSLFFQHPKPSEELYDIPNDPHEVNNLAGSPGHEHILIRMRTELAKWIKDTGDLGGLDEEELINRMWPGKKQPATGSPVLDTTALADGRLRVKITCPTKGASIGYRLTPQGRWLVYTKPIVVARGDNLQAKAIRIGYSESEMVQFERIIR